jgi:hypothetical protein
MIVGVSVEIMRNRIASDHLNGFRRPVRIP